MFKQISTEGKLAISFVIICMAVSGYGGFLAYKQNMFALLVFKITAVKSFLATLIFVIKDLASLANILLRIQIIAGSIFTTISYGFGYGYELYLLGVVCVMFLDIKKSTFRSYLFFIISAVSFLALFYFTKMLGFSLYNLPEHIVSLKDEMLFANLLITVGGIAIYQQFFSVQYFNDILKIDTQKDFYQKIADYDALTGVLNRQSFYRIVGEKFLEKNHENIGVLIIDIDDFKSINDSFGHDTGDMVLTQVVGCFSNISSSLVARWGGEEFVLLFVDESFDDLSLIADELKNSVRQIRHDISGLNVSVSVGGVFGSRILDSIEQFDVALNLADKNLYFCKNHGKNMAKISQI